MVERITRLARLALFCNVVENVHSFRFLTKGGCMQIPPLSEKRKICALSATKKHSPNLVSAFVWSGLRDSLGSLLRSPTRTRPTNSPLDCSLLRNGLFESRPLQFKNKKLHLKVEFYFWSGLRDSNSLPSPWQGDALPDELNPQLQDLL